MIKCRVILKRSEVRPNHLYFKLILFYYQKNNIPISNINFTKLENKKFKIEIWFINHPLKHNRSPFELINEIAIK